MKHRYSSPISIQNLSARQRGQMLLIVAFAMIGLLAAAGLAVDGGFLFLRKAQLDRATDSAALAGVVDLYKGNGIPTANVRGEQFLAANGIVVSTAPQVCTDAAWTPLTDLADEYCGLDDSANLSVGGGVPGVRYRVETQWCSEVFFMRILGFGQQCPDGVTFGIPIHSTATAELSLPDNLEFPGAENGVIDSPVIPSSIAQGICEDSGNVSEGFDTGGVASPILAALAGTTTYRIVIPDEYWDNFDTVNVELFDPDTYNTENYAFESGGGPGVSKDHYHVWRRDGTPIGDPHNPGNLIKSSCNTKTGAAGKGWVQACSLTTEEPPEANPVWFIRVDEAKDGGTCGTPTNPAYSPPGGGGTYGTETVYRLYYLTEDGEEVDLAWYIGDPTWDATENRSLYRLTDLQWVTPTSSGAYLQPTVLQLLTGGYYTDIGTWAQKVAGANELTPSPLWCSTNWDSAALDPDPLRCVLANVAESGPVPSITSASLPSEVGSLLPPGVPPEFTTAAGCQAAQEKHDGDGSGDYVTANGVAPFVSETAQCVDYTGVSLTMAGGQYDFIIEESELFSNGPGSDDPGDEGGVVSIFLQIIPLDGTVENGYHVWVGPYPGDAGFTNPASPYYYAANPNGRFIPSDVNARNMFLFNLREVNFAKYEKWHSSFGIKMKGRGLLIFDGTSMGTTSIPLLQVTPQMAGQEITVLFMDAEKGPSGAGTGCGSTGTKNPTRGPLYFHIDSYQPVDWSSCFDDVTAGGPGEWACDDEAPLDGGSASIDCTTTDIDPSFVDLENWYVDEAFLTYTGSPPGRNADGFIPYTFTLPDLTRHGENALIPPYADWFQVDYFRQGILYMTFWGGWEKTYAIMIETPNVGNPALVE